MTLTSAACPLTGVLESIERGTAKRRSGRKAAPSRARASISILIGIIVNYGHANFFAEW
jgi:hypothetical protein